MKTGRTMGAALVLALASCMVTGPSRVAQGQLYVTGSSAYDDYFRAVHQQQVEAASWDEDREQSHRALVSALALTPDAPDVTIVQATHEAASKGIKQPGSVRLEVDGTNAHVVGGGPDAGLLHAVEETSHAELERARRLHAIEPKIEALLKQGNDLQSHVKEDWAKRGSTKEAEVENELRASVSALATLKSRADGEARESEDFVADLERALETASEDRVAKHDKQRGKREDKGRPEKRDETTAASRPSPAPKPASEAPAAPAPKPAPPPKPADTGEVFTP